MLLVRHVIGVDVLIERVVSATAIILILGLVRQEVEYLLERHPLILGIDERRYLGRTLDELHLRVHLLDESVDDIVLRFVDLACVLLLDVLVEDAVLECDVEVLVQHEVA